MDNVNYNAFRNLPRGSRILLAFSGGVDSSIAAQLCKDAGMAPLAVNMRLLDETEDNSEKIKKTADALGIELEFLDLQSEFREKVMHACWNEFSEGRTPNPCTLCNPVFKFGELMNHAKKRGCAGMATGHYARIVENPHGDCVLMRGIHRAKDQSYFMYGLSPEQLSFSYMPLGALTKEMVRIHADALGLPNANDKESQDACFSPKDGALAEKLRMMFNAEAICGNFIHSETGRVLGEHNGIHAYTIGQRKGTGIALGKPAYVKRISKDDGTVEITDSEDSLLEKTFRILNPNWQIHEYATNESFRSDVQIRYRSQAVPATVRRSCDNIITAEFDTAQRAVTPGQSAVFYMGDTVIGGGIIA